MVKIIGLAGLAGSGKNTVADMLAAELSVTMVSLAEPIKRGLLAMFSPLGVTEEMCFGSSSLRDSVLSGLGSTASPLTVRHALQTLGTEWGRHYISPEVWIKVGIARCLQATTPYAIITDVRYENEMRAIRDANGEVWHLENVRSGRLVEAEEAKPHASEVDCLPDPGSAASRLRTIHMVNGGSLNDLRTKIKIQADRLTREASRW